MGVCDDEAAVWRAYTAFADRQAFKQSHEDWEFVPAPPPNPDPQYGGMYDCPACGGAESIEHICPPEMFAEDPETRREPRHCWRCGAWSDNRARPPIRAFLLDDVCSPSTTSGFSYSTYRHYRWTVATTYAEAVEAVLGNEPFDIWTLDHNLGWGVETGESFFEKMAATRPDLVPPDTRAHSGDWQNRKRLHDKMVAFQAGRKAA